MLISLSFIAALATTAPPFQTQITVYAYTQSQNDLPTVFGTEGVSIAYCGGWGGVEEARELAQPFISNRSVVRDYVGPGPILVKVWNLDTWTTTYRSYATLGYFHGYDGYTPEPTIDATFRIDVGCGGSHSTAACAAPSYSSVDYVHYVNAPEVSDAEYAQLRQQLEAQCRALH